MNDGEGSGFPSSTDGAGAVSVALHGEVDLGNAPELAHVLKDAIDGGARLIVVKLDDVTFIDSTGLRTVIAAANEVEELGGQLFIEGASPAVAKVFEVTGLIERLRAPES